MKKTDEQRREEYIVQEMGTCKHFTGIQNEQCRASVNIRQLVGGDDIGWGRRIPCLTKDSDRCNVTCSHRDLPTREQAELTLDAQETCTKRTLMALSAAHADAEVKGLGKDAGGVDSMICPTECGGTLKYSVSGYNGHMHAACSTKDCVRWME